MYIRRLLSRSAHAVRWLTAPGRRVLAAGTALAMVALTLAAVTMATSHPPAVPAQQVWGSAAGRSHRVSPATTMGRIVNGRLVPRATHLPGPAAQPTSGLVKDGVPLATKPARVRLPARGISTDKVRALATPRTRAKVTGYNPKTSRRLPLSSAGQITYANVDGTKTALDFQSPVNYRKADGAWATISTTLVTDPAAPHASPPATPLASPSPSASAPPSRAAASGWTERSEAEPETFAAYADDPDLVSVPLGGGRAVAFGVAGAASAAGVARGGTVTYPGVARGSDLSFTAGTGQVTEQIVLHSASVPASWVFPLELTGLRAEMGPGGIVEFADTAGKVLAYVPHGFMTDSDINPHSGDGAMSSGVTYSLTTVDGRQAIRMTLDTAWLDSRARVYPVTVDPSITTSAQNADGTTYVLSPYSNDYSSDGEIDAGTWDKGTNTARSFLSFSGVSSALKNDTVLGVRLGVFNTWSYSCSPRAVYVYPVTSSWSVTGDKTWPGPSIGSPIGRATFGTGWVPLGSTVSPCPASWQGIDLDQAGTNLVNGWTHGTVANDGLALGASDSDSYAWKKFAAHSTGTGDPFLAVTYTPDGASYKLASTKPVQLVEPAQNGEIAVRVTNTGSSTWDASDGNGYELSYRVYNAAGKAVTSPAPAFTPLPSTVAPGQSVTVDATVSELPAGSYVLDFSMYSGGSSFVSDDVPPLAVGLYVPQPAPSVTGVYPPSGYVSPTLTPQLSTTASTASGTITYDFAISCDPLPGQTCPANEFTSGTLSNPYWTVPSTEMQWNTPYEWEVTATVNGASTTVGPVTITPEVPQPDITSGLGDVTGQDFDPHSGNYTTSATDAAVASAGPPLRIARTYNSLDPRTSGAFGAGWSSVIDAALRPDGDGSGDVVVTLPGGQELRFGENGNGTYAAPFGSPDVLVKNSSGTWTLMDSSNNQYDFNTGGQLTEITDAQGLSQTFTYNSSGEVAAITNPSSGRTLSLTWSGAHVVSVTTNAPSSSAPGFAWTYNYSGDELTSACGPLDNCTTYSYTSGSHYRSAVLDSGPRTYWQLGDASGSTTAADEVAANLGTTDGTYSSGVTLGAAGPLAGSSETAASFSGTASDVSLPADLITDGTDVTIELWFKAASSTSSGVLFSYDADALSSSAGNTDHHDPALYVGGNGELYGELWNGSIDPVHSTTNVDNGAWHYAVLTGDSTGQSLYLDGSLIGTMSGQINQMNMTVDTIGAGFWQGGWPNSYTTVGPAITDYPVGYFTGDIAQVAVYPHPLGQPAITSHYALAEGASPEMTQVTLPSGNTFEQASYDAATGRLASYTNPDGGQWTIGNPVASGYKPTSDGLGQVLEYITVTDPAGRNEVYGYDVLDGGRLVSYSRGADPPQTYGYDAAGHLATVTDADGNQVCLTSDIHGNVLTRTWYSVSTGSIPGPGTGAVTGCAGSTTSSATCPSGGGACTTFYSYYYDASNPLDPRNDELTAVRDGRSASATDGTYLTTYAYNTSGELTSVTTPATSDFTSGRTTTYTYSAGTETAYGGSGTIPAGLLLSQTTPGHAATSYQYYSDGDLARATEPSGRYTVYTYDGLGRPVTSTVYTTSYTSGLTTSYSYTSDNQPATVTSPGVANQVTGATHTLQDAYSYDADGNLLSETQSDLTGNDAARTTTYTYNDHDEVATVTQPAGATTGGSAQSDGASSAHPDGATTGYDYDGFGNVTQVTDPDGNAYRYTYNEYNEITQKTLYTASQNESTSQATCTSPATQDADGGCDLVIDSYAYDPAGLLAAVTDAMGRITNYAYNADQELLAETTTDGTVTPTVGKQTTYTYDGAGNVVGEAVSAMSGGAVGTTTTTDYTVDAADRLDSQLIDPTPTGTSDSGYTNRQVTYAYNADNDVTSVTTGAASEGGTSVTDYGYDIAGDMTSKTVQDGSTSLETTWTYNQDGQPLSMTTPEGNVSGATAADYTTSYTYDQAGNLATETGPPVATRTYASPTPATTRPVTTYGYDTFGDQTQSEDPDSDVTSTSYGGDGRVASVTRPSYTPPGSSTAITATTAYAYDEDGNLAQVTDPENNVTSYTYDALGDETTMTTPMGTTSYTYDADGEQVSATDPANDKTSSTWNYFGEQATSTDARNNTTQYLYDYLGDLTKQTTPDGVVTSNTYDHLGELLSTANTYGNTTSYDYNDQGRVYQVQNPDGSTGLYGYDEAGNQTSVADYGAAPAGESPPQLRSESFGYDPNGDLTSVKDWDGNTTTYGYNAVGALTSQVQPVSSSASDTTSYGYDPEGNQTSVTDPDGNTTWTTYNSWNLPESVIKPLTATAATAADATWTTAYNADGQAATVTQPGGITLSYGYNPLGEMTSESGSGASAATTAQSFGYDLDGRLTSATAPGGTDAYTYNADSELTGASGPSGSSSFSYNNDDLVSWETDSAGTTGYTYDSADRPATETDPLTGATLTYGYNADSQPTSIQYASGGASGPEQTLTYDDLDRLASDTLTSATGKTLASEAYGYDADGNLTSQTTGGLLTGAGTTTYGYDEADRLTSATTGGTTTAYAYDGDGNLTQEGGTSYSYNAQDQLTSSTSGSGTTGYGYTLSGVLASVTPAGGSAQTYTSNAYGQQVSVPGGVSYAYDALGRLVTRGTSSGSSGLSWLGTGDSLASDGTGSYSYDPSGSVTAVQASGGQAFTTLSDQHEELTATFSPTPAAEGLAGSASYSPYGTVSDSGYRTSIGYQGDYTDPSTGQVDMNARWYDPAAGSFTAGDTIDGNPVPATMDGNPYAYADGNPLTNTDPSGNFCWDFSCLVHDATVVSCYTDPECAFEYTLFSSTPTQSGDCPASGSCFGPSTSDCYFSYDCSSGLPAPSPGDNGGGDNNYNGGCGLWCGVAVIGVGIVAVCLDEPELCAGPVAGPPPPPPPPPPQDCYAGPNPACTPPSAPKELRDRNYQTSRARLVTSARGVPSGNIIGEELPPEKLTPSELQDLEGDAPGERAAESAKTQGSGGNNADGNAGKSVSDAGTPNTPDASGPDNGPSGSGSGSTGTGEGGNAPTSSDTAPQQPTSNPPSNSNESISNEPPSKLSLRQRVVIGAGFGAAGGFASGIAQHQHPLQIVADTAIGAVAGGVPGVSEGLAGQVVAGGLAGAGAGFAGQLVANNGIYGLGVLADAGLGAVPALGGAGAAWRGFSDLEANISAGIVGALETAGCGLLSQGKC